MSHALVAEKQEVIELPALGAPFGGGFFAGEHVIAGERYALIVAAKAAGEKFDLEYKIKDRNKADGTDSDDDGLANSDRINDKNHPAAEFCRSLRNGDYDDWYLPSRDELMRIWMVLGPNRKNTPELFRAGRAEAFEGRWYWSSTEHASYADDAWGFGFGGGGQYGYGKDYGAGVRAVRRLKI
jgi:hypothetical protein